MRELVGFFEAVANHLAFLDEVLEVRVGDVDALLFEGQRMQIAPARPAIAFALAATLAVAGGSLVLGHEGALPMPSVPASSSSSRSF